MIDITSGDEREAPLYKYSRVHIYCLVFEGLVIKIAAAVALSDVCVNCECE